MLIAVQIRTVYLFRLRIDPTGVGMTMSALREPELVTSENIDSLSGVFDEVIGAVADTIMGVLFSRRISLHRLHLRLKIMFMREMR